MENVGSGAPFNIYTPAYGYTGQPVNSQNAYNPYNQNMGYPAYQTPNPAYYTQPGVPQPPNVNQQATYQSDTRAHDNATVSSNSVTANAPSQSNASNNPHMNKGKQKTTSIANISSRVTAAVQSTSNTSQRHNTKNQPKKRRTDLNVADGNLTIELPAEGATVEKPPDGGAAAWKVVFACTILNACSSASLLTLNLSQNGLKTDIGEDESENIITALIDIRLLAAPLTAIAIVLIDYRKVAIIGSVMVAVGFFISGFLTADTSGVMGLFLSGVAGIGLSFWYLSAIIPILEYFQTKRLRALIIANLGTVLVIIIMIVVLILTGGDIDWRLAFKLQSVVSAVAISVSFLLRPLKLTMKSNPNQSFVATILGVLDFKIFKELTLYLVMCVYFFDQFGRPIPTAYIANLLSDKSFSLGEQLANLFLSPLGTIVGSIVLVFWKKRGLILALLIWGPMDIVVGYLTLQIPAFDKFGWIAVYSTVFGFTQAVVASLLNNTVPDTFGVANIRVVEGLLGFSAGLGAVISSPAADSANTKHGDAYTAAFYLAASMMITSGVAALITRYLLIRKGKESPVGNEDGEKSNDTQTDTKKTGETGDNSRKPKDEEEDVDEMDIEDIVNNMDFENM